jgi:hypothetical protein
MKVAEFRALQKAEKGRSKYGNKKTVYNGREYDSGAEAERAQELDLLIRGKVVREWIPQYPLEIKYADVKICTYYADFKVVYENGDLEYEDVKGFRTEIYKLKKKLVKAFYGIDIKEINYGKHKTKSDYEVQGQRDPRKVLRVATRARKD